LEYQYYISDFYDCDVFTDGSNQIEISKIIVLKNQKWEKQFISKFNEKMKKTVLERNDPNGVGFYRIWPNRHRFRGGDYVNLNLALGKLEDDSNLEGININQYFGYPSLCQHDAMVLSWVLLGEDPKVKPQQGGETDTSASIDRDEPLPIPELKLDDPFDGTVLPRYIIYCQKKPIQEYIDTALASSLSIFVFSVSMAVNFMISEWIKKFMPTNPLCAGVTWQFIVPPANVATPAAGLDSLESSWLDDPRKVKVVFIGPVQLHSGLTAKRESIGLSSSDLIGGICLGGLEPKLNPEFCRKLAELTFNDIPRLIVKEAPLASRAVDFMMGKPGAQITKEISKAVLTKHKEIFQKMKDGDQCSSALVRESKKVSSLNPPTSPTRHQNEVALLVWLTPPASISTGVALCLLRWLH
jgi:hypothetical protein